VLISSPLRTYTHPRFFQRLISEWRVEYFSISEIEGRRHHPKSKGVWRDPE
jgi:hypothetical protein